MIPAGMMMVASSGRCRESNGKFKYDGPAYSAAGYIWNAAFLGNKGAGAPTTPYPPQTNQSTDESGKVSAEAGTNAVGSYRKTFTISDTWKNKMVFLNLTGVSSDCYIWVNGKQWDTPKTAGPTKNLILPRTLNRVKTSWPSRCFGGVTGAGLKTRT